MGIAMAKLSRVVLAGVLLAVACVLASAGAEAKPLRLGESKCERVGEVMKCVPTFVTSS